MKIKLSNDRKTLFVSHDSIEDYINALPKKSISRMKTAIKRSPSFCGVSTYDELVENIKEDKEMLTRYRKSSASVSFPPAVLVRKEKQWRDSGNIFDYNRYVECRPCVGRIRKTVEYGASRSNIVPVFVNLSEPSNVKTSEMIWKAIATIEYVKACQAQGKNVEVYACDVARQCFASDIYVNPPFYFVELVCLKRASAPLIPQTIIAGVSASFFRCYLIKAKVGYDLEYNGVDFREHGFLKAPTISFEYGYATQLTAVPDIEKWLASIGIHDFGKAVCVPSGLTSEEALARFRKEHGLTVK